MAIHGGKKRPRIKASSYGKGWIVYSDGVPGGDRELISILPANRNDQEVLRYLQQIYVDRHGSLDERLEFKKRPRSSPFAAYRDGFSGMMYSGHGPYYHAVYATYIRVVEDVLRISYRIVKERGSSDKAPVFENKEMDVHVP